MNKLKINESDIRLTDPKEVKRCLEKIKEDKLPCKTYKCLNLKDISRSSVLVNDIDE